MDHAEPTADLAEAAPVTTMDADPAPRRGAANIVPSFLAELTRAMQAAAEQQREQIAAIVADDAAAEIDKANARGAIEADELRRLADEDIHAIDAWLAEETERIRAEAGRRTEERRCELDSHLVNHHSIIASEVAGVENAVRVYRATLDSFFAELGGATNPAKLARQAGSLPTPPDLEAVRASARADAVAQFALAATEADAPAEPAEGGAVAAEPEAVPEASVEASPEVRPGSEILEAGEPVQEEAGAAAEDEHDEDVAAAVADEEPADEGVGLGVMDPAAVGRPEEVAAAMEPALTGSVPPSSAAIRLFRTLTDWAQPNTTEDHRDTPQP